LSTHQKSNFDHARDELLSHIHRCGVLKATPEQQDQWLDETMQFMSERYTDLSEKELADLKGIGSRFCQPVIAHGRGNTALSTNAESESDSEQGEMAGVA
jgi:hypothetical protein